MNTLFIYMVKVAIYLAAFYCVYALMLSRDTFYNRNRAFIILAAVSSMLLPFITLQTLRPMGIQFFGKILSDVFITTSTTRAGNHSQNVSAISVLQIIYTIYIAGVILFLLKFIINFINLLFLILRQKSAGSHIISFHGFNTSGFSAMGFIFLNSRLSPEEAAEIIRHEHNHLKNNHFIDIIFFEIFKSFQWFNPTVYLFDRSLRAIHEYQADQGCINSGVPVKYYQSLLLSHVFKSRAFNLTNSFSNPSLIKRRMVMMTKRRTPSIAGIKLLIVIPVTLFIFLTISGYKETGPESDKQSADESIVLTSIESEGITPPLDLKQVLINSLETENSEGDEVPFVTVEEMPVFPGGDIALLKYIGEHTAYPQIAKENNIQGKVVVRFCITSNGNINQISTIKSVSPELDAEAQRVVSTLPSFTPGKQGGKAVPVWYMVPITFTLR